jgi:hypothetical protein
MRGRSLDRRILSFSMALFWYLGIALAVAEAQSGSICPCSFKEPPWEAYGTKAACTAIVRKGGTSCEIEFGGISADPKVASQVLGVDPSEYTKQMYDLLGQFLQYLRDNKRDALADPKFLSAALPFFMRGAYLRRPLSDAGVGQARSLDASIVDFTGKYSDQISKIFLGNAPPDLKVEVRDAQFIVGRGTVTVYSPFGSLITRYMPAE